MVRLKTHYTTRLQSFNYMLHFDGTDSVFELTYCTFDVHMICLESFLRVFLLYTMRKQPTLNISKYNKERRVQPSNSSLERMFISTLTYSDNKDGIVTIVTKHCTY